MTFSVRCGSFIFGGCVTARLVRDQTILHHDTKLAEGMFTASLHSHIVCLQSKPPFVPTSFLSPSLLPVQFCLIFHNRFSISFVSSRTSLDGRLRDVIDFGLDREGNRLAGGLFGR